MATRAPHSLSSIPKRSLSSSIASLTTSRRRKKPSLTTNCPSVSPPASAKAGDPRVAVSGGRISYAHAHVRPALLFQHLHDVRLVRTPEIQRRAALGGDARQLASCFLMNT